MLQHGGPGREPSPSQRGQDGWSPPNPSMRVQRERHSGRGGWGWPVVLYWYRRGPGHAQTAPGAPKPATTTNSGSASVLTARRSEAERSWRGGAAPLLARQVGAGNRAAQGGGPTGAAWVDTGDPAGQKGLGSDAMGLPGSCLRSAPHTQGGDWRAAAGAGAGREAWPSPRPPRPTGRPPAPPRRGPRRRH